jgi:hypothetical protein
MKSRTPPRVDEPTHIDIDMMFAAAGDAGRCIS